MPEPPLWRSEKGLKPLSDVPTGHWILTGRVLTCVGDQVIEDGFVEVDGERIKAVGDAAQLGTRRGEALAAGGTLLPGLFNNHAHLAWDGINDLIKQSVYDSPETSAYKSAANMLINLRSGVTTVRDLGMNKSNFAAKQAVEHGIFPGPRLLITGEAIVQTGGHTYWCCREASGPDEMRRAVRDQVRGGADLIKIMANHDTLEFTDAELEAVLDEAHRNRLPVTAHATFDAAIERVAQAGVNCIEHGGSMKDSTIQLLLDRKIPIVTTFAATIAHGQSGLAREYGIPEARIADCERVLADPTRFFADLVRAAKAGVTIAFGTDAGSPMVRHDFIVPEMQFMVELGVVPDNYGAICSATRASAQINGLADRLGTLEAGKLADVIVVGGDPLQDLEALRRVRMTFRDGRRFV